MAAPAPTLLSLPAEIRYKIWNFAFANTNAIPLESSIARRKSPIGAHQGSAAYDTTCHGCAHKVTDPDPYTLPVANAVLPLLVCRQIHAEAINLYQTTLHVHACLTSELQVSRRFHAERSCAQRFLRHLSLRIHLGASRDADIQEDMRHLWLTRLSSLGVGFPALEHLHVTAHMRPPTGYENLIDAIYFAGPLCHLPSRIKLSMDFNYLSEGLMVERPDLGRICYSDALEEHTKVIEDCMEDLYFREAFYSKRSLEIMTQRLLEISQEHEQPWLLSLRRRKIERDREEAMMNARASESR